MIPKKIFPRRMEGIPLYLKLNMHHIQVEERSAVMEKLRMEMVDEGDAVFTVAPVWEGYLDFQDELDKAYLSDEVEYESLIRGCKLRELDYHIGEAVQDYLEERADIDESPKYPDLVDRALACLERMGLEGDEEWVEYVTEKYKNTGAEQEAYNERMFRYIRLLEKHDAAGLIGDPEAFKQRTDVWEGRA